MRVVVLILGSISIFIFTTCTKFGKNITVKGRVLNPITGEGIAEIEINLLRETVGKLPGGFKKIKSVKSDENGYYVLDKLTLSSPVVQVNFPGTYYSIGWWDGEKYSTFTNILAKRGKVTNMDYHLVPYGNYKLIITNINCQGINDSIILNQTNQVGSFLGIDWVLTGCSGYTTANEKTPSGTVYTHYTVIKNGISTSYNVNFEILPNQDNIQSINY